MIDWEETQKKINERIWKKPEPLDFTYTKSDIMKECLFVVWTFAMGALFGFGVGAFFV